MELISVPTTASVMNETRDSCIQDTETHAFKTPRFFADVFFFNKLGMSTKLFKGRHMHQTVNNSNSRKTEWTVRLGQGAFWDLRLLYVNTDSLSTRRSLKHNKHATALISTVIVNHEISPKNEKKKKIKSAAMLTFQELLLFSDKVFKKKPHLYDQRSGNKMGQIN